MLVVNCKLRLSTNRNSSSKSKSFNSKELYNMLNKHGYAISDGNSLGGSVPANSSLVRNWHNTNFWFFWPTDRQTDGPTDTVRYRSDYPSLKNINKNFKTSYGTPTARPPIHQPSPWKVSNGLEKHNLVKQNSIGQWVYSILNLRRWIFTLVNSHQIGYFSAYY